MSFHFICLLLASLIAGSAAAPPTTPSKAEPAPPAQTASVLGPEWLESFDASWRIINDSYFDPSFHGVDWNALRDELRPKAEAARTVQQLRAVIEEMLGRLGDSHMALIPGQVARTLEAASANGSGTNSPLPEAGSGNSGATPNTSEPGPSSPEPRDGGVGLEVRILGGRATVTRVEAGGVADEAGVKSGWIIEKAGDHVIDDLLEPMREQLDSVHGRFVAWGLVMGQLLGRPGTSVRVTFLDETDQPKSLELRRRQLKGEGTKLGFLPTLFSHLESQSLPLPEGGSAGLIRFNIWMVPVAPAFDAAIDRFRHADGVILDLRGNVGGLAGLILGLSGHFLNERVSLGTLKMRGNELKFFTNPRRTNPSGERVEPYAGPVAILIDPLSLSATEIFAAGMQDLGRARIFGEASGGQALPAIWDRLPSGDVLYHAFGDFVTPSGARVESHGVKPNETVPTRREDLLKQKDAPLLAAQRWIAEQKTKGTSGKALTH